MSVSARLVADGACYHINTRGNQRQRVFKVVSDYEKYIAQLKRFKKKYKFKLYGYCLMPNHVHLVGETEQKGNLAKFMHGLTRSYTIYFNRTYQKVEHLWQGRFKSKIIIKDIYLLNCINYIELNPVRAGIVASPEAYRWSSYRERNLGVTKEERILDELSL